MAKKPHKDESKNERTAAETARIEAKTLKALLSTPPKPYTPAKDKKPKKGDVKR